MAKGYARRTMLRMGVGSALYGVASAAIGQGSTCSGITFGVVTDCHYAELDPSTNRYYRASLEKLRACVQQMNALGVDFLVELGDFKDQGRDEAQTLNYLQAVEAVFREFKGPRYHVLGNHDMDRLSKAQFQAGIENTGIAAEKTYYSFDQFGRHFVVLDANFRRDGQPYDHGNFIWTEAFLPDAELAWLRADLAATRLPVVVFIHQLLDGDEGAPFVRNAAAVRAILETSGKVRCVFQGHEHAGRYALRNRIHYCTVKGLIEGAGVANTAFVVVKWSCDDRFEVVGYGREKSMQFACT